MAALALCAAAMDNPEIKRLDKLFAAEPDRLSKLTFETAGIYFDWTKTHLDADLVGPRNHRSQRSFARILPQHVGSLQTT